MGSRTTRGTGGGSAAALLVILALLLLPSTAAAVATPSFTDGGGVHVVSARALSPRLFALRVTTPLLTAPTNLRILLPADYDANAHPNRRYPVLWLYHGTSGGAADWTQKGDAEATTAGRELIVVMPDAGVESDGGGWFTDWVNGGRFGPPMWETWHIDRLLPWIDGQLRTRTDRGGSAIFGLSQGGFGALSYASRHPDLFGVAGSFSGADDISANPAIAVTVSTPIITATEVGLDGVPPGTFFGNRLTDEVNWAAHDPATLAGNLRATSLYAYTGNGRPGPLDPPGLNLGGTGIKAGAHELTQLFVGELVKRGIPIDYHDYGPGTHTFPYWARDLRDVVPAIMRDFARPPYVPPTVDYQSADAHFSQWGWDVAMHRPARELAALLRAGASGFTLTGSGSATVQTPAVYAPRRAAKVSVTTQDAHVERAARTDADGRLRVEVPLGPGNPAQQFTVGAVTRTFSTRVRITAPRRAASCRAHTRLRIVLRQPPGSRVAGARASSGRTRLPVAPRGRGVTVRLGRLSAGQHRVTVVAKQRSRHGRTLTRTLKRTVCA